uniref:Uncharacterized protein n=1 Tax=Arundo donax TaxID=35708 RepID=A0A0A9AEB7_ARUDO
MQSSNRQRLLMFYILYGKQPHREPHCRMG